MKKGLILACLIAFVVQYENFNHFVVMLVVGDFDVRQAWSNAFRYFDIKSAFFVGCFRLIPFVLFALVMMRTDLTTHIKGKATLIVGFIIINVVIFLGYWSVTESLYTDAHTPSTSAITYMSAPIAATFYSAVACSITYFLIWLSEVVYKRK